MEFTQIDKSRDKQLYIRRSETYLLLDVWIDFIKYRETYSSEALLATV